MSGRVLGGPPARLVLYLNGVAREVAADGGSFQASVTLERGLNHLRVVATDWRGVETADAITVEYVPPPVVPNGVAITSPPDGHTVAAGAPPVVIVEGRVEDRTVSTVWLVANDRRVAARVRDGRFRVPLPFFEPELRLWAEISPDGRPARRSPTVTVRAPSPSPPVALLVIDWPEVADLRAEVSAAWRASPGRLDVPAQRVLLKAFEASSDGAPVEVFYLRNPKPGVYTLTLRYRASGAGAARATLYLAGNGRLQTRDLRPVSLDGAGQAVIAKVLLPHGVLWEEEEWFTGRSESAETVTKFRFPEGITWTEPKTARP